MKALLFQSLSLLNGKSCASLAVMQNAAIVNLLIAEVVPSRSMDSDFFNGS